MHAECRVHSFEHWYNRQNKYKNQTQSVVNIFTVKSSDITYSLSYLSMMSIIFEYDELVYGVRGKWSVSVISPAEAITRGFLNGSACPNFAHDPSLPQLLI